MSHREHNERTSALGSYSLAATKTRWGHVVARRAKGVGREEKEKGKLSRYPRVVRSVAE